MNIMIELPLRLEILTELYKFVYGNVINALQIIIESRRKHLRRCTKQKEAIAFLHQDVKFSPTDLNLETICAFTTLPTIFFFPTEGLGKPLKLLC